MPGYNQLLPGDGTGGFAEVTSSEIAGRAGDTLAIEVADINSDVSARKRRIAQPKARARTSLLRDAGAQSRQLTLFDA